MLVNRRNKIGNRAERAATWAGIYRFMLARLANRLLVDWASVYRCLFQEAPSRVGFGTKTSNPGLE